jgi:3',5'-cyclic AMP phosphodiesterase CpdA
VEGIDMSGRAWHQLSIVHLSDLHFGSPHRFQSDITPAGDRGPNEGIPALSESVLSDLRPRLVELHGSAGGNDPHSMNESVRTIFAFTGDLTETAAPGEFVAVTQMMEAICSDPGFDPRITADDMFVVPGNHDLEYAAPDILGRWMRYCDFYQKHATKRSAQHAEPIDANRPQHLSRIIDQSKSGLIVAEINSAAFVAKDTPEAVRGSIDVKALTRLRNQLEAIPEEDRNKSIRIAMIHHHPVVLPTFAEPGRGYDAIVNADRLLGILKSFQFHLVLHGHKHAAQTFPYDSVSAWSGTGSQPMMVVSGGSVGSKGLPTDGGARNTYNIISFKWHPASRQARLRIETRGLVLFDAKNDPLLPPDWHWCTLRIDDRLLKGSDGLLPVVAKYRERLEKDDTYEQERDDLLKNCRRCFPVIDVLPSFHPDQGFEARVWIDGQHDKNGYELPQKVEWNAGRLFSHIAEIDSQADPTFSARFAYYGPMVIQARMFWADGYHARAYIFAHYPGSSASS